MVLSRKAFVLLAMLGAVLASVIGLSGPVAAQPIPTDHNTMDPRGVDLITGKFTYARSEVVIGQPGQGGIAYGRIFVGSGNGWRDTLSGTLNSSGSTYVVSIGGESETFNKVGSVYINKDKDGSQLTQSGGTYTFTSANGAVATFINSYVGVYNPYTANTAIISTYQLPNGEKLTWYYVGNNYCTDWDINNECIAYSTVMRLQSVANNLGYQIHYLYVSDNPDPVVSEWLTVASVIGINTAVDYCAPDAAQCTGLTETWPSVTYTPGSSTLDVTDQSSRTTTYTFGTYGLTGIRYPGSTSDDVSVTYNSSYQVTALTDVTGAWTYSYATSGSTRTTTSSGPLNQQTTAVGDLTTNRLTSLARWDHAASANRTWYFTYDTDGRLTRTTQPEGNYTDLTYDARGNVTTTTQVAKSGSGLSNIVSSATFASSCSNPVTCNRPTSTTDPLGNVTTYSWDSTHGGLLSVTQPAVGGVSPQTRYTYTSLSAYVKTSGGSFTAATPSVYRLTEVSACITAAAPSPGCNGTTGEAQTVISYGSTGTANNLLPTSIAAGDGSGALTATTTFTYDHNSDVASVDGPVSNDLTEYRYDDARQQVGVIGPDPDSGGSLLNRAQRLTYDSRGNVTLIEAGTTTGYGSSWSSFSTLQRQSMAYDALGRPITARTQSSGGTDYSVVQSAYDTAGRVSCTAVRMNPAEFSSLPTSACTADTAGYFGPDRIATMTYSSLSQLLSSTTGASGDTITESVTYTNNGLPASLTDGNGNVSILEYDGFDRLSKLRYPNASGGGTSTTDYEQYTYDANGQVLTYRDRANQTSTTTYDQLNRVATFSPPNVYTQTFEYDNLGRMTGLSGIAPYAWAMSWTYDALGRQLTQGGAFGGMTLTSTYDLAGRRTSLTWPDSVSVTYVRDPYGAITDIRLNNTTSLSAYAYDNLGRLTGITRGNGASTTYGYDAVSRLTSLAQDPTGSTNDVTITLGYNPASQIFSRAVSNSNYIYAPATGTTSYTINGLNRVTAAGGTSVTYDSAGNITGGLGATLGYDDQNNLNSAAGTTTWLHDPLGRMYNQVVSGTTTRFAYDGMKLATEYSGSSGTTIAARHVPGLWMDDIALTYSGSNTSTPSWPLTDERGSVIALTDGSGAVTGINTYDEFGVPSSGNAGRFQYTGQMWLLSAGVYDYKLRAYAAQTGRFAQLDQMGFAAGSNLYGYVGNDPVNVVDPLGLMEMRRVCTNRWVDFPGTPSDPNENSGNWVRECTVQWWDDGRRSIYDRCGRACRGGDVRDTAEYRRWRSAYGDASDRHSWMLIPVAAAVAVPLVAAEGTATTASGLFRTVCNCFVAGTPVHVEGGVMPIESLHVGDLVLARDEFTGETALRPITALIAGQEREIWEVVVEARSAGGLALRNTIGATGDHPWRLMLGEWVETAELHVGDQLRTADGQSATVVSVTKTARKEPTFNFEVEGFHTYFVGEIGLWVHNACSPNKLHHLFGNARHGLGGLVNSLGSRVAAYNALQSATQAAVASQGLTGVFETSVVVAGQSVTVRGIVIGGAAIIGTAFIP